MPKLFNFMSEFWAAYGELILYISIPITSAIVGWGTNVLALKMTFYPVEFIGIKPYLGWQGIIPSKAKKMAQISVDLWTTKLVDVKELFAKIKPEKVAEEMRPQFDRMAKEIMDEFMARQFPDTWERLPGSAKRIAYARISRDMPKVVADIMADVKENIEDVFDIKEMVVKRLMQDKELLNEIFLKCGREEFKFIERSGIYFGFLFGLVQMAVWYVYDEWWILPLFGLMVGFATNWLALKLIFQPVEPISLFGVKFQGLFIKRQNEVATEYAAMLAHEIFTFDRIFAAIVNGKNKQRFIDLVSKHAQAAIDDAAGFSKPLIKFMGGDKTYDRMKKIAVNKTIKELPRSVKPVYSYAETAMDLNTIFRTKMINLSPKDFVGFLRPVFQEDELKLILVGAALGMAAGFGQLFFVFGV
jgi:uncharacterized membrane protein YheB (UPF0754 family)